MRTAGPSQIFRSSLTLLATRFLFTFSKANIYNHSPVDVLKVVRAVAKAATKTRVAEAAATRKAGIGDVSGAVSGAQKVVENEY